MQYPPKPNATASGPFFSNAETPFASAKDPFSADELSPGAVFPSERAHERDLPVLDVFDREDRPLDQFVDAESDVALEVVISWGATVLHVAHLSPPRTFVVGEMCEGGDLEGAGAVDFLLPEDALGRKQLPLVVVEDGSVHAVLPDFARGTVKQGKTSWAISELLGSAPMCPTVTRAKQQSLEAGTRVRMELLELSFHVSLVKKAAPMKRGLSAGWDSAVPAYFGATAFLAGSLMASLAYFVPPLGLLDDEGLQKDRVLLISQYLNAASEREKVEEEESPESDPGAEASGQSGKKAEGEEGEAGKKDAVKTNRRVVVKGPRDNTQLQLAKQETLKDAVNFGMIGLLNSSLAADPNAPVSPFGGAMALGSDDLSANGNMWGDMPGESGGAGGLGISGPGFGGGALYGSGLGIGIGRVGTIGPGTGKEGFGRGNALTGKGHKIRDMSVGTGKTRVNGHLPRQVIQRVVRQNFGRFRNCYSQALGRNPSLEGRIPVRFIIGSDGAVTNVSAGGDFPDSSVRSCVQSAFYGISFPAPKGGIVTVTYPILFSPG